MNRAGTWTLAALMALPLLQPGVARAETPTASFAPVQDDPAPSARAFPLPPSPSTAPPQQQQQPMPTWQPPPAHFYGAGAPAYDRPAPAMEAERARSQWMWSVEGVTRAPVDMGVQTVLQTPVGLRLGAGYGVIPGAYLDFVTDAAAGESEQRAAASIFESGRALRLFAGVRPSSKLGLYGDVGLVRATLDGSWQQNGLPARYDITSRLNLWFAEVGYQGHVSRRLVLGVGLGVVGMMSATTEAVPNRSLGASQQALTDEASASVDRQLEEFGLLPSLTLRLGFDLL